MCVFYMEDAPFTVNKNQIALVYVTPVAQFLQVSWLRNHTSIAQFC